MKRVSVPVFETSETRVAEKLMVYIQNDPQPMSEGYVRMLTEESKSFRQIFLHIRDKPREGCLIHCAIGKDRTGVAVILILSVAGVSKQEIAEDYTLTNAGLEPYKPVVRKLLESMSKFWWDEEKVATLLKVR